MENKLSDAIHKRNQLMFCRLRCGYRLSIFVFLSTSARQRTFGRTSAELLHFFFVQLLDYLAIFKK